MRFYISPDSISPDKNIIEIRDKQEIHHIRDVMRLKIGNKINAFDGMASEFSGVIREMTRDSVIISIEDRKPFKYTKPFDVVIYQAVPKKNKMNFIVEKAVELGVDAITPIITDRTIPAINNKACKRIERWRKIAIASSKQCGRVRLPLISDVMDFKAALAQAGEKDLRLLAALDKEARPLKSILRDGKPRHIAVFIGPEGDFSPGEISMAKEMGFIICSLGPLVMKSDTAAMYLLSCLWYELQ
jgi:16S rRNA (uracil1498-N3)-methyltransferase